MSENDVKGTELIKNNRLATEMKIKREKSK